MYIALIKTTFGGSIFTKIMIQTSTMAVAVVTALKVILLKSVPFAENYIKRFV
jgi:hypothetical protein